MLVPDFYWQCSAFLCQSDDAGTRVPKGTAFFVRVPVGIGEIVYVVTVGHNVQFARAAKRPLYLRMNCEDGRIEDIEIKVDAWAESGETDLAVTRFPVAHTSSYEFTALVPAQLVTDELVAERRIGPGDEVFFCGLFTEHPGRERSQPIVRWGNVSMLPGERVRVKAPDGGTRLIDAYLVEARSWGGQSGSPAFVFFPPDRELGYIQIPRWSGGDPGEGGKLMTEDTPLLLGVVQGHFNIKQDVTFKSEFDVDKAHVSVNTGIAVVIPAQKIIDLLNEDDLVRERDEYAAKLGDAEPAA